MYQLISNGDVPDEAYFNGLMNQSVIVCTSGTRPSSPTDGMVIYETDTAKTLQRTGTVWRRIPKDAESGGPWEAVEPANDTSTGTSAYVAGTSQHGTAFVAPPSGRAVLTFSASLGTNGVTSAITAYLSFELRAGSTVGSGTVVLAASDSRSPGLYRPNNTTTGYKYTPASMRILLSGLTVDSSYNVRSMFRTDTTSASVAVANRYLLVEPVL